MRWLALTLITTGVLAAISPELWTAIEAGWVERDPHLSRRSRRLIRLTGIAAVVVGVLILVVTAG